MIAGPFLVAPARQGEAPRIQPVANLSLLRRAIRLWPDNKVMQREWLRAVALVRSTKRGWVADDPVRQAAGRA